MGIFGPVDPVVSQLAYLICPLKILDNFCHLKILLYLIIFSVGNYIMAGLAKLGFVKPWRIVS